VTHSNLPSELEDLTAPLSASVKVGLISLLTLLLTISGLSIWSCHGRHHVAAQVQQADVHHEAAVTAMATAEVHDAQAQAQVPVIQADADQVAALRREVARLRAGAPVMGPAPTVGPMPPDAPPAPVDLAPVVAAQDRLISALDHQVADQAQMISALTLARDSWRLSAQQSAAEAVQLRSALAAQQGLAQAALWKGRIQGFLVGAGGGYLGGRMR